METTEQHFSFDEQKFTSHGERLDILEKTVFIGNGERSLKDRTTTLETKMGTILALATITLGAVLTDIASHIPWHIFFN